MKKVVWTLTARKSLLQTSQFITELWNEQVTDDFMNLLDQRIMQVQKNPKLAPPFKNSEFRQLLIHPSVSLFYRNYPHYLKLLIVWDNRQDPAELLRNC